MQNLEPRFLRLHHILGDPRRDIPPIIPIPLIGTTGVANRHRGFNFDLAFLADFLIGRLHFLLACFHSFDATLVSDTSSFPLHSLIAKKVMA